jgi:diacylglycerol kinase family enzyme
MSLQAGNRVTLVHNPQAGDEDHSRDRLLKLISNAGYEAMYVSSKEDLDTALQEPGDLVAIAGGDGTVRKVVTRILGRRVPVALLPTGTANNICKSLNIIGTPEELVAGWASARRKKFTVGLASSSWGEEVFVEGVGLGLFSKGMSILDHITNEADVSLSSTSDKVVRDLTALVVLLSEFPPIELKVDIDGQKISGPFLLTEILNINSIGPNLRLAPGADPGDDNLECVFLPESKREAFAEYLTGLLAGKEDAPPVDVLRGKHIQIHWEGSPLHLDDKIWTNRTTVPPPDLIAVRLDGRSFDYLSPAPAI